MHLSSPIPAFLVIVHQSGTIKTADTIFGEPALEAYKQNATEAGYHLWIKSLDDVVRECSAFDLLSEIEVWTRKENNREESSNQDKPRAVSVVQSISAHSRHFLSLAASNPA